MSLIGLSIVFMSACSQESAKDTEYDTTKKMVIDILQTDDGKKALKEIMTDEEMKEQLIIESDTVKDSINDVLVSQKGADMWKNLFSDPAFVESFATSMAEEQEKLMKNLMNDADYQKQMLELLQNPEITEQMLDVMKSQKFRSHLEETIQQTIETPLFQAKMKDILLKAAENQGKNQGQEEENKKEDSGSGEEEDKEKKKGTQSGSGTE